jgi:hypothetical protein
MCGLLGRLMAAVRGEGRELLLCCGPALLLPHTGRQDEERLPIERGEAFVWSKTVRSAENSS